MAVTFNASTSSGLIQTADTSGVISLQNNGTVALTLTNGDLQFNSGYGSAATAYGCRAWVNFNGTGTVAIRGSGNVTSITDNGTGDYTINFTNAMPDTKSSVVGSSRYSSAGAGVYTETYQNAVGTAKVFTRGDNGTVYDAEFINVSVFR